MGWKCAFVVVSNTEEKDPEALLRELGYGNLSPAAADSFDVAMYPRDGKAYVGHFNGHLVIADEFLAIESLEEGLNDQEQVLLNRYPGSEIASFSLHSVTNFWGYSLVRNGQKIRLRAGFSNDGVIMEEGDPLPEEAELLSKSKVNAEGIREYWLDDDQEEPYEDAEVGEEFVFQLASRYFDRPLDHADNLIFETKLQAWRVAASDATDSDSSRRRRPSENIDPTVASNAEEKSSKKWIYIGIAIFIIVRLLRAFLRGD